MVRKIDVQGGLQLSRCGTTTHAPPRRSCMGRALAFHEMKSQDRARQKKPAARSAQARTPAGLVALLLGRAIMNIAVLMP